MRTFEDGTGGRWDVVAGRESWGVLVAIFVPRGAGERGVRQAPLQASDYEEAASELRDLDDEGLRTLLRESEPRVR